MLLSLARLSSGELREQHSQHFAFRTDVSEKSAAWITRALESLRGEHVAQMGLDPSDVRRASITIFRTRAGFESKGREFSSLVVGAHGITTPEGIFVYLGRSRRACVGVLMHELTHMYLRQARKNVAAWLNEGLACYFGGVRGMAGGRVVFGVLNMEQVVAVNRAVRKRQHVPLKRFLGMTKREFYAGGFATEKGKAIERVVYGQAASLVHFLKRSKGVAVRGRFPRFLEEAYACGDTTKAFESVYGADYTELERLWAQYLPGLVK